MRIHRVGGKQSVQWGVSFHVVSHYCVQVCVCVCVCCIRICEVCAHLCEFINPFSVVGLCVCVCTVVFLLKVPQTLGLDRVLCIFRVFRL